MTSLQLSLKYMCIVVFNFLDLSDIGKLFFSYFDLFLNCFNDSMCNCLCFEVLYME